MNEGEGFDRVIVSWQAITEEARSEPQAPEGDADPEAAFVSAEALWEKARPEEAREPYELAAKAGHVQAAFQLGWLVLNEDGDRADAQKWWRYAASERHAEAAYRLAELLWEEGKTDEAAAFFEQAANEGYGHAAYQRGWLALNENHDASEAVRWWRKGASEQDQDAAFQLAEHFAEDEPDQAKRWYKQAAESGHGYAAYQLGQLLDHEGNREEAVTWMNVARDGGEQQAATELQRWQTGNVTSN